MKTLFVTPPSHNYPIFITDKKFENLSDVIKPYLTHQVAIVTNETVGPLYLDSINALLDALNIAHFSIVLPDGEKYKHWETLNLIYSGLLKNKAERNTTLLALGGGVIGDMGGFAAATYQRGMPFIQVPTTLLSQVDSSVGGKTAINHPLGKNMIGAFYQPQAVLTSINTLNTLPDRELSAGLSEIIKIALIWDKHFFQWLEDNIEKLRQKDAASLSYCIERSCEIKADIVSQDEKEYGVRTLLNLGHTFGHAIETEAGYGNWLHGEAVAAGIVLASRLSQELGFITQNDHDRIVALLAKANLPTVAPDYSLSVWLEHMSHDKKVTQSKLKFILLQSIGNGIIKDDIDDALLAKILLK